MAILRVYALPHPVLAIPAVGRGGEREIKKTLKAFDHVAKEIARLRPDTIIFLTPHNVIYDDYFHISPGEGGVGNCEDFGTKHVKLSLKYDPNYAAAVAHLSAEYDITAKTRGKRTAPLDHGVMVPLWFINRRYTKFKAMRISPSGLSIRHHYRMGQCLQEAASNLGRRTVVIASGNLSDNLGNKAESDLLDESLEYDREMLFVFSTGEFDRLLAVPRAHWESADACGHLVFAMMAGCLDRRIINANLLSYDNTMGEGYAVASFNPGPPDERRNFLERSQSMQRRLVMKSRADEDAYCTLARRALEHMVLHGIPMPVPSGLPQEMLHTRAGVFVSLYVDGKLRGAAGALGPTADHVAAEIVQYAVQVGQGDKRFHAVAREELAELVYKVDVIGNPEPVEDASELDPQLYGLIITSGDTWGVMLPNQDGVETGEEQIAAVMLKAGIEKDAPMRLERFHVHRHEY